MARPLEKFLRPILLLSLAIGALLLIMSAPVADAAVGAGYAEIDLGTPDRPWRVSSHPLLDPNSVSAHGHGSTGLDGLQSDVVPAVFDLVGLIWDRGEVHEVWVQVMDLQGSWSEWIQLGIHYDEGAESGGTDPLWAPDSLAFRFKLAGDLEGGRAGLISRPQAFTSESDSGPATAHYSAQSILVSTSPSGVNPRSMWDTDNCQAPDAHAHIADVHGVVIHHASSNNYQAEDVPMILRAICSFHVNGRGWSDIGYNFIVDTYGSVWEGRSHSLSAPISGAHAAGFNSRTQGVAMLGNFSNTLPSSAQESALIGLLDWMTGWYLINPRGTVTMVSRSDGSLLGKGDAVTVPTIMGHRDLGSTSCPGDDGYSRLPYIRLAVQPIERDLPTSSGDELLQYSSDNGRLLFKNIDGDGAERNPVSVGWHDANWTSVEALALGGDDMPELQFYDANTGAVAFYRLTSTGEVSEPIRMGSLGRGWTTMEPAETDGDADSELFFYRASDGRFGFYQLDGNGMLGHAIRVGWFGEGWTSVEPIDIDGDGLDEMMFYRETDGRFALYRVGPDGELGSAIRIYNFGEGWDQLEPFDVDGNGTDELLFYRYSDGRFALYEIDQIGVIGSSMGVGNYSDQWTSITSVDLDQ